MAVTWHGEEFKAMLRKQLADRLEAACEIVEGEAKQIIKEPYPPASRPGEPPHSRRFVQGLLGSVFHDVDVRKLRGIVGTNMIHGLFLENWHPHDAGQALVAAGTGYDTGTSGSNLFQANVTNGFSTLPAAARPALGDWPAATPRGE